MKCNFLLLLFIFLISHSCNKSCHDPLQVYDLSVVTRILDKYTQESIIREFGSIYDSDNVTITDLNGDSAPDLHIDEIGGISFTLAPDFTKDSLNKPLKKIFFIRYDITDTIDPIEIDTLILDYNFDQDDENCDEIEILNFSIIFSDSTYVFSKIPSLITLQK